MYSEFLQPRLGSPNPTLEKPIQANEGKKPYGLPKHLATLLSVSSRQIANALPITLGQTDGIYCATTLDKTKLKESSCNYLRCPGFAKPDGYVALQKGNPLMPEIRG